MNTDNAKLLQDLYKDVLNLKKSPLYTYRTENKYVPVIGDGNPDADIMFIGEAPGKNEAITGKPFCGAAGRILDELLQSVNINRSDVYISNIVKDRPPENRDPTPAEIELYSPFLDRQLEIIRPKVIVTLGRFSMDYIMRKFGLVDQLKSISFMHGKEFKTKTTYGTISIVPLYHPAVALYQRSQYNAMKQDFTILKKWTHDK